MVVSHPSPRLLACTGNRHLRIVPIRTQSANPPPGIMGRFGTNEQDRPGLRRRGQKGTGRPGVTEATRYCGMDHKPNSVPVFPVAAIYLGGLLPDPSSDLPGTSCPRRPDSSRSFKLGRLPVAEHLDGGSPAAGAGRDNPWVPYLVLHPVGFTMPATSPPPRCALTAPFHPYLGRALKSRSLPTQTDSTHPRRYIFCGTFPHPTRQPATRRSRESALPDGWALPTTVPCGVRTFLPGLNPSDRRTIPRDIVTDGESSHTTNPLAT